MQIIKYTKYSAIAFAMSLSLTGCFLEGDDGASGAIGAQGEIGVTGTDGSDGQDAKISISLSLVGRIQLNPDDPEGAAEIVQFHAASNTIYASFKIKKTDKIEY